MKLNLFGNGKADLLIISSLALLLVPLVMLTSGPLRIALGLLFILFFPGYTLIATLFPRKGDLDGIERVALSFGLSLAVVPLIGLVMNFTPWGIRLWPILLSLLGFILTMASIALYRRGKLLPQERFQVSFRLGFSRLALAWGSQSRWDRVLTLLLMAAIVGAIGTLIYVIQAPRVVERFTEFYILGPEGKAQDYPRELTVGEAATVVVGIANQERQPMVYRVEVSMNGQRVTEIGPITLNHQESWEREVSFAPARTGPNQKVEFLLYRGEGSEPHRTLHLWVGVEERRR